VECYKRLEAVEPILLLTELWVELVLAVVLRFLLNLILSELI